MDTLISIELKNSLGRFWDIIKNAADKIDHLEKVNSALHHENSKLKEDLANTATIVAVANERIDNLTSHNSNSKSEIEQFRLTISYLQSEIIQLKEVKSQFENLSNEHNQTLEIAAELQKVAEQNPGLIQEVQKKDLLLNELKSVVQNLQEELAKHKKIEENYGFAQKEITRRNFDLHQKEDSILKLKENVASLESKLYFYREIEKQLDNANSRLDSFDKVIAEAYQEKEELISRIEKMNASFENDKAEYEDIIRRFRNEIEQQNFALKSYSQKLNDLNLEKSNLENAKAQTFSTVEEIKTEIDRLNELVAQKDSKIRELEALQSDSQMKESQLVILESEISQFKMEVDNLQTNLESEKNKFNNLENELLAKNNELEAIQNTLKLFEIEKTNYQSELSKFKSQFETANNELEEAKLELELTNEELQRLTNIQKELQSETGNLKNNLNEIEEIKSVLNQKNEEVQELNNTISSLQSELETLQNHYTANLEKHESIDSELTQLQANLNEKEQQIERLKEYTETLTENLQLLQEEHNEILHLQEAKIDNSNQELIDALNKKLDESRAEIEQMQFELIKMHGTIAEKNALIAENEHKINGLLQEKEFYLIDSKLAETLQVQIDEARSAAEEANFAMIRAEGELTKKEEEIASLQHRINGLLQEQEFYAIDSQLAESLQVQIDEARAAAETANFAMIRAEGELTKKEEEIASLQHRINGLLQEQEFYAIDSQLAETLQIQIDEARSAAETANFAMIQAEGELTKKEEEIALLQHKINTLLQEQELYTIDSQLAQSLQEQLDLNKVEIDTIQNELNIVKSEKAKKEDEIAKLNFKVSTLLLEEAQLLEESQDTHEFLEQIEALKSKISTSENEISSLKHLIAQKDELIAQLHSKMANLIDELSKSSIDSEIQDKLENQIGEYQSKIEILNSELSELKLQFDTNESKIAEYDNLLLENSKIIDDLKLELQKSNQLLENSKNNNNEDYTTNQNKLQQLEDLIQAKQKENEVLQVRLESMSQTNLFLERKIIAQENSIEQNSQVNNSEYLKEIEQLRSQLSEVENSKEELESITRNRYEQIKILEEELNTLINEKHEDKEKKAELADKIEVYLKKLEPILNV